jgi:rare lipoprotein A
MIHRGTTGAVVTMLVTLVGCSTAVEPPDGRPLYELKPHEVAQSTPKPERIVAAGNSSPYRVNGGTYYVMKSAQGYRERGIASWYGRKFHGRRTANGEVFNAYAASAAHRSLPIPSYVQVTNLENGRSMTVRVNDRGPFHPDRIIDLSYAAAVRLGFDSQGTAPVEVVALSVDGSEDLRYDAANRQEAPDVGPTSYRYIQVGAFSQRSAAHELSSRLRLQMEAPVRVSEIMLDDSPLYRVRVGPVDEVPRLRALHRKLVQLGYLDVRMMPE